ncbi:hypothetical protein BKA93DRAFT_747945 [Sparassis latifolia]
MTLQTTHPFDFSVSAPCHESAGSPIGGSPEITVVGIVRHSARVLSYTFMQDDPDQDETKPAHAHAQRQGARVRYQQGEVLTCVPPRFLAQRREPLSKGALSDGDSSKPWQSRELISSRRRGRSTAVGRAPPDERGAKEMLSETDIKRSGRTEDAPGID